MQVIDEVFVVFAMKQGDKSTCIKSNHPALGGMIK
jgi:hypothetical protein